MGNFVKQNDLVSKYKVFIKENSLILEDNKGKSKFIDAFNIKKINLVYAKCPNIVLRNIPIFVELFTIVFIILAIVFKNKISLCVLFIVLALLNIFLSALIGKIIYKYAPDALEFKVIGDKKYKVLFYKTNDALFNKIKRVTNDLKAINNNIEINISNQKK
ncbi:MAG: hypothetical protein ACI35W_08100 [Anaeroplasmataceae bacterium]